MNVSDLAKILGQSQPRVSRHLKLLSDAGLVDRYREGSWAYYRLSDDQSDAGKIARQLVSMIPKENFQYDQDRRGFLHIKQTRVAEAEAYFNANAKQWDEIRSLQVDESEVEAAISEVFPSQVGDMLDVGTGTGRMLQLFAGRIDRGVGIDLSHDMLSLARTKLESDGYRHCYVRHCDMYHLPMTDASFDVVVLHQVLHYAENPEALFYELSRVLRPDGKLLVVDFAPHGLDVLRRDHAHRWMGFSLGEIAGWCSLAGLRVDDAKELYGDPLTVLICSVSRVGEHSVDATRSADYATIEAAK